MMKTALLAAVVGTLLGLFPLGSVGSAPLGPPIEELLAIGGMGIEHPSHDAIVLYSGVEITLEPDGRISRRVRLVQRLLTDRAIGHLGDPRVAFDTGRQELQIEVNRTFMRDRTEVNAKAHAFNLVTPDHLASCPDRMGVQEMVISHVGVERGCLVELLYTLRDRESWRPWLEGTETIGREDPVLRGEIRITVPDPKALRVALVNLDGSSAARIDDGATSSWSFGPIDAFPHEGGVDPREIAPALLYSTCPSWETAGAWLSRRLAAAAQSDSAIFRWTDESMEGGRPAIDDRDRIRRTAHLLSERMHASEDAPWTLWLEPRPAARTFDSSCGNLLDRAALGWAVLRAWGIDATPVLMPIGGRFVREVPGLAQGGEIRLAGPFGELSVGTGRFEDDPSVDDGEERFPLLDGSIEPIASAPRPSTCRMKIRLHENEDGSVIGEVSLRMGGAACRESGAWDVKTFLDDLAASACPDGKLAGFRIDRWGSDSLDCTLSLTAPRLGASVGGGRSRVPLPIHSAFERSAMPSGLSLDRQNRVTPIRLPSLLLEELELRVELTPGTRILTTPPPVTRSASGASIDVRVDRDGGTWTLRRRFVATRRTIPPGDYHAFKDLLLLRVGEGAAAILLAHEEGER